MGYQLRMHEEIRGWLTGLRDSEPERAREAGEAVLALLEAGEALGPPLVVPLAAAVRELADPRRDLDASYQRQLESLTRVRRGVADVATSRKRLELQAGVLEQQAAKLDAQRGQAQGAGREDLAREAARREAVVREQLSDVRRQCARLAEEEEKLSAASQRLQARADAFRVRKETMKAAYAATEASRAVRDALAGNDTETGGRGPAPGEEGAAVTPGEEGAAVTPGEDEAATVPPGVMELRVGDPAGAVAGLLFAVEPRATAVLLAHVHDPSRSRQKHQEAIRIAASRLAAARSARSHPAVGASRPATFISYDAESFLDEFFPGEEAEVETGAGALTARYRALTLAQARQRMGLTQAQVAQRMRIRQERVSAIERAEPGATEVRTLAAYVRALGGGLEITAHVGGERIRLR